VRLYGQAFTAGVIERIRGVVAEEANITRSAFFDHPTDPIAVAVQGDAGQTKIDIQVWARKARAIED